MLLAMKATGSSESSLPVHQAINDGNPYLTICDIFGTISVCSLAKQATTSSPEAMCSGFEEIIESTFDANCDSDMSTGS